jgi:hypothetical protein
MGMAAPTDAVEGERGDVRTSWCRRVEAAQDARLF